MKSTHPLTPSSFEGSRFSQRDYPQAVYQHEVQHHRDVLNEYAEIQQHMDQAQALCRPNLDLYKQQPYLTFSIRLKLIDFLTKMAIRLKILPFVLYKAVRIFDRYCSKRIVLLDQSQLIITTCLWVAAKIQGGNNHFVNLNNLDKVGSVRTIVDLGYGSGGKYLGPTERFRLPKLHELVKLCGAKCKYDQGMFKQMELHVLTTLDWSLNDPSIEEYIVKSDEFSIVPHDSNAVAAMEMFKVKEYLAYVSHYSAELIDVGLPELSHVVVGLINEVFGFSEGSPHYQRVNSAHGDYVVDSNTYRTIKRHLVKAILNTSDFMLKLFCTSGPQHIYRHTVAAFKGKDSPQSPFSPDAMSIVKHSPSHIYQPFKQDFSPQSPYRSPKQYQKPYSPKGRSPYKASPKRWFNSSPRKLPMINTAIPPPPKKGLYSQSSLNSSVSSRSQDGADLFEEYRRVGTPLSENESPIYIKTTRV